MDPENAHTEDINDGRNGHSHDSSRLNADFLEEYNSEESIRKYTRNTAGYGISYLLDHEYGEIYRQCIDRYVPKSRLKAGIRLWEFGCGGQHESLTYGFPIGDGAWNLA